MKASAFILAAALIGVFAGAAPGSMPAHPGAPRVMNYYLRTDVQGQEALLAQWDLVVLPFQLLDDAPASLELIRTLRAGITTKPILILAYIDPFQIPKFPNNTPGHIQHDFVDGIADEWLARNPAGEVIEIWNNSLHVNFTSACPVVGGETFREYFVDFVEERLFPHIATGLIDGVFLDEMSSGGYLWWDDQPLFNGPYDYDGDGLADDPADLEAWMVEGVHYFADATGARLPAGAQLMGNNCKPYLPGVTGKLYEAFPAFPEGYLPGTLHDLDVWDSTEPGPHINTINAVYEFTDDLTAFRYRYAASLLADSYFSFDASTFDHYQTTWYDLYDFELGLPLGQRYTLGETPVLATDFEGELDAHITPFDYHSATGLTTEPGLVIEGMQSLLAETNDLDPWPTSFYLDIDGGWQPEQTYQIAFRFRTLATGNDETQLLFKTSPGGLKTTAIRAIAGSEGLYRGSLTLGSETDYTVRFLTWGSASVVIDSLSVVVGEGGLWARDYEHGAVVCNASGVEQVLPYNPDWTLVDADDQHAEHAAWLGGGSTVLPAEDGLVFAITEPETASPPPAAPGARVELGQPWPNPFNPRFSVVLGGRAGTEVALDLFDPRGRRVAELWRGMLPTDGVRLSFDLDAVGAGGLPSGVYLLQARGGGVRSLRKLVLLR